MATARTNINVILLKVGLNGIQVTCSPTNHSYPTALLPINRKQRNLLPTDSGSNGDYLILHKPVFHHRSRGKRAGTLYQSWLEREVSKTSERAQLCPGSKQTKVQCSTPVAPGLDARLNCFAIF